MNDLVSVVIPCYNAEKFILQTLTSVLQQSHQNFEIIFVNDGSTDNSLALVKSLNHDKIIIIDKKNSGVSETRNIGLENSNGDYILFLDADDMLSKKFLEEGIKCILENNVDFCTSYIKKIDIKNNYIDNITTHGVYNDIQRNIATFNPNISACPSSYIYIKNELIKNNITFAPNLKSPEDRHFLFQVGKYLKGSIINKDKAIMYYRVNTNSLSHQISEPLLKMQELFYLQTIQDDLLPDNIKKIFTHKMAYQLASTFLKLKELKKAIKYLILYFKTF